MFPSSKFSHVREGISIIEVLTSIVVAMIGVFGVMILIPFAVKQAKTGLDSDAATVVARNAYDLFEIGGYRRVEIDRDSTSLSFNQPVFSWFQLNVSDGALIKVLQQPKVPDVPQIFSIDPLGVTENDKNPANNDQYSTTTFPIHQVEFSGASAYPSGPNGPGGLVIPVVNLGVPGFDPTPSVPMTKADARRMFRASDELVFGESIVSLSGGDAALNGPQQIFDKFGNTDLRRQFVGSLSWSAIVVPQGDNNTPWKYRMHVLVYKDRVTDAAADESKMRTAQVTEPPMAADPDIPVSTVTLDTAPMSFPEDNPDALANVLRKDDWVMLINEDAGELSGIQLGFYRVVNFDATRVTLDGPNFDFTPGNTHFVHLKDVVGVYERSFTPEGSSNWNTY